MQKYRNIVTEVDGIRFDSRHEAKYYGELKLLQRAGAVQSFQMQVPFVYLGKTGKRLFTYKADFVVTRWDGSVEVVDTKGMLTPVYRLKKKLIEDQYGIKIVEVYAKKKRR